MRIDTAMCLMIMIFAAIAIYISWQDYKQILKEVKEESRRGLQ